LTKGHKLYCCNYYNTCEILVVIINDPRRWLHQNPRFWQNLIVSKICTYMVRADTEATHQALVILILNSLKLYHWYTCVSSVRSTSSAGNVWEYHVVGYPLLRPSVNYSILSVMRFTAEIPYPSLRLMVEWIKCVCCLHVKLHHCHMYKIYVDDTQCLYQWEATTSIPPINTDPLYSGCLFNLHNQEGWRSWWSHVIRMFDHIMDIINKQHLTVDLTSVGHPQPYKNYAKGWNLLQLWCPLTLSCTCFELLYT